MENKKTDSRPKSKAAPAARRLAIEIGIEIDSIVLDDPNGVIQVSDVLFEKEQIEIRRQKAIEDAKEANEETSVFNFSSVDTSSLFDYDYVEDEDIFAGMLDVVEQKSHEDLDLSDILGIGDDIENVSTTGEEDKSEQDEKSREIDSENSNVDDALRRFHDDLLVYENESPESTIDDITLKESVSDETYPSEDALIEYDRLELSNDNEESNDTKEYDSVFDKSDISEIIENEPEQPVELSDNIQLDISTDNVVDYEDGLILENVTEIIAPENDLVGTTENVSFEPETIDISEIADIEIENINDSETLKDEMLPEEIPIINNYVEDKVSEDEDSQIESVEQNDELEAEFKAEIIDEKIELDIIPEITDSEETLADIIELGSEKPEYSVFEFEPFFGVDDAANILNIAGYKQLENEEDEAETVEVQPEDESIVVPEIKEEKVYEAENESDDDIKANQEIDEPEDSIEKTIGQSIAEIELKNEEIDSSREWLEREIISNEPVVKEITVHNDEKKIQSVDSEIKQDDLSVVINNLEKEAVLTENVVNDVAAGVIVSEQNVEVEMMEVNKYVPQVSAKITVDDSSILNMLYQLKISPRLGIIKLVLKAAAHALDKISDKNVFHVVNAHTNFDIYTVRNVIGTSITNITFDELAAEEEPDSVKIWDLTSNGLESLTSTGVKGTNIFVHHNTNIIKLEIIAHENDLDILKMLSFTSKLKDYLLNPKRYL